MAEHYFTPSPAAAHRPGQVHVVLDDLDFECATDAGVFSAGRLDPGTRVLLDTVPPPPGHGDLLDLGTGYGPVALAMAARAPGATVWAVDVNQRALELCAGNAQAAGLPNVRCVAPDAPGLPGQFAAIWSNPPIRIGKPALHGLLASWLGRLAPGGRRLPGRAAQPGCGLAAPLARGPGLDGAPPRVPGRLPCAGGD